LWESALHCGSLFDGTLFDTMPVLRRECGESLLEGVDVEESDRKGTDATTGAAESAGNFTEQSGGCPLEPVIGFLIQRRWDQWCATCHGGSLHLGGEIHDEIALG
jgi:hypothetical protein